MFAHSVCVTWDPSLTIVYDKLGLPYLLLDCSQTLRELHLHAKIQIYILQCLQCKQDFVLKISSILGRVSYREAFNKTSPGELRDAMQSYFS